MTDASDNETVRDHFDGYAGHWHERIGQHSYYARFLVVKRMVSNLRFRSVIDVGCGTGDYAEIFDADKVDYLGLDISPEMVKQCQTRFPRYRFAVCTETLPVEDRSIDLAIDVAVIEYYEDCLPHLRELARAVRPGGTVIVVSPNGDNRSRAIAKALDDLIGTVKQMLGSPRPATTPPKLVQHHHRGVEALRRLGREAGLELVEHEYCSLYVLPELRPAIGALNTAISKRCSGPGWQWLARLTGTNMICRFIRTDA